MKIFTLFNFFFLFLVFQVKGQSGNSNPFFKEEGFFVTQFEENLFKNINKETTTKALDFYFAVSGKSEKESESLQSLVKDFCLNITKKNYSNERIFLRRVFL